jgi:hypothetical protein
MFDVNGLFRKNLAFFFMITMKNKSHSLIKQIRLFNIFNIVLNYLDFFLKQFIIINFRACEKF